MINLQQLRRCGNALRLKCIGLRVERRQVIRRWLLANGPVGLAADEGEVRDVVCITRAVDTLEHGLWKDVVELEPVLRAGVIQSDCQVRLPVFGPRYSESQKHGFE